MEKIGSDPSVQPSIRVSLCISRSLGGRAGAPEERVSGQFMDKDRIKRGQSVVKERIYPYFRHPLSSPSLCLPIDLTLSSVHPTHCPYP